MGRDGVDGAVIGAAASCAQRVAGVGVQSDEILP